MGKTQETKGRRTSHMGVDIYQVVQWTPEESAVVDIEAYKTGQDDDACLILKGTNIAQLQEVAEKLNKRYIEALGKTVHTDSTLDIGDMYMHMLKKITKAQMSAFQESPEVQMLKRITGVIGAKDEYENAMATFLKDHRHTEVGIIQEYIRDVYADALKRGFINP